MKTILGGLVGAVLLLLSPTAFASNPAPGVQVIVKNGSSTVFRGVTDGSGKFYTPPLAAGTYLFDVRGPKALAPNRYFLALSGARPLGEAMTNTAGDLAMQAEVRDGKSVRGQVRAFRVLRNPLPMDPAMASTSSASGVGFQNAPVPSGPSGYYAPSSQIATTRPVMTAPPASMQTAARPAAAAQTTARPVTTNQMPVNTSAPAAPSAARPATPLPLMIGGKRFIWVATTPGSTAGRWVLDKRQPSASQPSASQATPVKRPSPTASPTPSSRR